MPPTRVGNLGLGSINDEADGSPPDQKKRIDPMKGSAYSVDGKVKKWLVCQDLDLRYVSAVFFFLSFTYFGEIW